MIMVLIIILIIILMINIKLFSTTLDAIHFILTSIELLIVNHLIKFLLFMYHLVVKAIIVHVIL